MNALHSILRAAHCRSTHHLFAIDALPMVQTASGVRLARLLLRHYSRYLAGATDPDTRYRDFQNHVIHATDGYWGGAPRVAHQWYDRLQQFLQAGRYADAAHAAGVLSHYFTDPMQPLHTQQCRRERVLHRPIEWSIQHAYDKILQCWHDDQLRIVFQLSEGPAWLGEAMLHGARFANRRYDQLLDAYDLDGAVNDPAAAISESLTAVISELFGLAITGWARVLERAASDAESQRGNALPSVTLAWPTCSAAVWSPLSRSTRWWHYRQQQQQVHQLVEEYRSTGDVCQYLPAEVDVVHRVVKIHREEECWNQLYEQRRVEPSAESELGIVAQPTAESESAATSTLRFQQRDQTRPSVESPRRSPSESKHRRRA